MMLRSYNGRPGGVSVELGDGDPFSAGGKIHAAPPWHYYCCLLAAVAALGGMLGGDRRLARGAALLWLVLTGGFCARLSFCQLERRYTM
jgi:hypothetical protein